MALYDRILEEIDAIGSHEEAAAACESVVDDVAKAFASWYSDNRCLEWATHLDLDQMYEQFKMSL